MYIWALKHRYFQLMRKHIFGSFFLILLLLPAYPLLAQEEFEDTIFKALKVGNATLIQDYFTTSIYIELPDTRGNYSENQARLMLDTFFSKIKPTDFKINQSGKAVDSHSSYYIGELIAKNGSFRVYLIGKPEQQKIYSISITEMP